ncbi:hypothetical protein HanRHA438_Chr12g0571361 [Helianthus annuus]|nr:hypothetical protein HanRHA438_Chr12g0571361 [Helianthus annuus]
MFHETLTSTKQMCFAETNLAETNTAKHKCSAEDQLRRNDLDETEVFRRRGCTTKQGAFRRMGNFAQ